MQLPKRGSSGSYRDLNLAAIYSKANAIAPSSTTIQMGGRTPIRKPIVKPMTSNKTRLEIQFDFNGSSI